MRGTACIAGMVLIAFAGCGGDNEEKSDGAAKRPASAGAPKPKEPLRAIVPGFEKAIASGDCNDLMPYGSPSSTGPPLPRPQRCRELKQFQRALKGFHAGAVAQFGTAGVIDGEDEVVPGKIMSTAWVMDTDGSWKNVFFTGIEPQVGRRPSAGLSAALDATVRKWVEAAKTGDCRALWRLSESESRFVRNTGGDRGKYCKAVAAALKGREPHTLKDFARYPDVEPKRLGAVRDAAFYGVSFPNGRHITIDVTTVGEAVPARARRGHVSPGIEDYVVNRDPR